MQLREIFIQGYKSIDGQEGQRIRLGDVTVLLGANGSGKSNLVSFFKILNSIAADTLDHYVGQQGVRLDRYVGRQGVNRLLYYGAKKTNSIAFALTFADDKYQNVYRGELSYGIPDRLVIDYISISVSQDELSDETNVNFDQRKEFVIPLFLSDTLTYQFHDTSDTAKIKDRVLVDDVKYLRGDGGNLAAFLRMLKKHDSFVKYYQRIVRHIRQIMPQFGDFDLESIPGNENYVRLNWTDSSGNEYLFDPDQISDGSLRYMALTALLLQPPELLPKFIVLDEPELGLHPSAIAELAGLIQIAAQHAQVLIATQSTRLVDEFQAENIVVVERNRQTQASEFRRLDPERLTEWLERYSLSELWEKNIFGGQP